LIAILGLILFCLHRRKKAKKNGVHHPLPAPPVELPDSRFPQEMSTPNVGKYTSPHPNELPAYPGFDATQSGATNYDHTSSHALHSSQAYNPASPSLNSYGSPQSSGFMYASQSPVHSPNIAEAYHPSDDAAYDAQQGLWTQQTAEAGRQRQHSYPSPATPQPATHVPAQQSQTYYPPPQAANEIHSVALEQRGSPVGNQYNGDAHYGSGHDMSTSTTPAQFYTHHGHVTGDRT
jgi:hypothetical protein